MNAHILGDLLDIELAEIMNSKKRAEGVVAKSATMERVGYRTMEGAGAGATKSREEYLEKQHQLVAAQQAAALEAASGALEDQVVLRAGRRGRPRVAAPLGHADAAPIGAVPAQR